MRLPIFFFLLALSATASIAQAACPNITGKFSNGTSAEAMKLQFFQPPNDCSRVYLTVPNSGSEASGLWMDITSEATKQDFVDRVYYTHNYFERDSFVVKSFVQRKKIDFCIEPKTNRRIVGWCPKEIMSSSDMIVRLEDGKLKVTVKIVNDGGITENEFILDRIQ